jgi:hypothetical protein
MYRPVQNLEVDTDPMQELNDIEVSDLCRQLTNAYTILSTLCIMV